MINTNNQTFALAEAIPHIVEARGALDFDKRGEGISPRRLPAWTRLQVPKLMDVIVRMPSGVRLRFATDSERVGITFLATNTGRANAKAISTQQIIMLS